MTEQYHIHTAVYTDEGTDFPVYRAMPLGNLGHFDPLVLVDEMGPDMEPGESRGFEVHPHAGLEVFSYVLDGTVEGQVCWPVEGPPVSVAKGGTLWINFGAGGAHYERPTRSVIEQGGKCHVVQLWFTLQKAEKHVEGVNWACFSADENPVWASDDGQVRVRILIGGAFGLRAPPRISSDASYLHASMDRGASISLPVPDGHVVMAYVLNGSAEIGGVPAEARQCVRRNCMAGDVPFVAGETGAEVLFVTGRPLGEPIEHVATFVMNSMDEIGECFVKYGRFLNIEFS